MELVKRNVEAVTRLLSNKTPVDPKLLALYALIVASKKAIYNSANLLGPKLVPLYNKMELVRGKENKKVILEQIFSVYLKDLLVLSHILFFYQGTGSDKLRNVLYDKIFEFMPDMKGFKSFDKVVYWINPASILEKVATGEVPRLIKSKL